MEQRTFTKRPMYYVWPTKEKLSPEMKEKLLGRWEKVQKAYFGFFKTQPTFPVLVIDMEGVDFVKNT